MPQGDGGGALTFAYLSQWWVCPEEGGVGDVVICLLSMHSGECASRRVMCCAVIVCVLNSFRYIFRRVVWGRVVSNSWIIRSFICIIGQCSQLITQHIGVTCTCTT